MLEDTLKPFFPGKPKHVSVENIELAYKRKIDSNVVKQISDFILKSLSELNKLDLDSVCVGLSGGIDSVITAALLYNCLGNKAKAIIIELDKSNEISSDTEFSIDMAKKIGITYDVINASSLYTDQLKLLENNSVLAQIHLRCRFIYNIVFQVADNAMAIVADTTDRSETILSIYGESFRGHIAPIANFYKSELYDFADYFAIPEIKSRKSGCPQLLDIDAFGLDWEILDPILYMLVELKLSPQNISQEYKIDLVWLTELEKRIHNQPLRTYTRDFILN